MHLTVQSGSDRVLERMRRGYSAGQFRDLVATLRERVPGIALSSDILSGFCGEQEDDHAATLALMREVRFDFAFMFSYSERDATYAARRIPDDVSPQSKKRRLREIVALQETISAEVNAAHVGRRERCADPLALAAQRRRAVRPHDGFKGVGAARQRSGAGRSGRRGHRADHAGDAVRPPG